MLNLVIFIVMSVGIIYISRASLRAPRSHGFYRFFAWECIAALPARSFLIPENIRNDAVQGIMIVFGLPVVLFFIARLIAMKTYRPNQRVAPRINPPTVNL